MLDRRLDIDPGQSERMHDPATIALRLGTDEDASETHDGPLLIVYDHCEGALTPYRCRHSPPTVEVA
jgi:hypothetical protein